MRVSNNLDVLVDRVGSARVVYACLVINLQGQGIDYRV